MLIETAHRLQHFIRRSDTAARLGGDEFALLLPTLHRLSNINGFANRLIKTLAQPIFIEPHELQISVSIGVGIYPVHGNCIN